VLLSALAISISELNLVSIFANALKPLLTFLGGECYCGNAIEPSGTLVGTGDCSDLCDGNKTEYCGGADRLDLYFFGNASFPTTSSTLSSTGSASLTTTSGAAASTTATGPVHVPTVGSYKWVGCYTDANGNRALTALTETNHETMTVEICASFCSAYNLFGVEYSMFSISKSEVWRLTLSRR
jgi:uncharacterized protein (UPF0333 family)